MRRLIIGFGHKRMRGKDTAAAMAFENLQNKMKVRHDAFAYSLKEMCRVVFGFSDEQLYGDLKGVPDRYWGFTPRWALQHVGTEAMRKVIDDQIWVKTFVRRAQQDPHTSILVTDLRFSNEATAIKALGGFTVRCNRTMTFDPNMDTHASEVALDGYPHWDYELDNNGSLDALRDQVDKMIDHMLLGELNAEDAPQNQTEEDTTTSEN